MKSRYLVTFLVFVVATAALGGIYLRLKQNSEDTPEEAESSTVDSARTAAQSTAAASAFATGVAVPVEGAEVKRGTFVLWVSAEGQAAALRRAPLHAQVSGSVIEVPVREGSWVSAGDVVARIDPTEYEISRRKRKVRSSRRRPPTRTSRWAMRRSRIRSSWRTGRRRRGFEAAWSGRRRGSSRPSTTSRRR
jgi:biotin carboxyl carrier protein